MSNLASFSRRTFLAGIMSLSLALGAVLPTAAQGGTAIRVLSIDGDTGALTVLDGRSGEVTGQFFLVNYYAGGKTVLGLYGVSRRA